jgi:hypothetical protein
LTERRQSTQKADQQGGQSFYKQFRAPAEAGRRWREPGSAATLRRNKHERRFLRHPNRLGIPRSAAMPIK